MDQDHVGVFCPPPDRIGGDIDPAENTETVNWTEPNLGQLIDGIVVGNDSGHFALFSTSGLKLNSVHHNVGLGFRRENSNLSLINV